VARSADIPGTLHSSLQSAFGRVVHDSGLALEGDVHGDGRTECADTSNSLPKSLEYLDASQFRHCRVWQCSSKKGAPTGTGAPSASGLAMGSGSITCHPQHPSPPPRCCPWIFRTLIYCHPSPFPAREILHLCGN
jgi:hypothetical protein